MRNFSLILRLIRIQYNIFQSKTTYFFRKSRTDWHELNESKGERYMYRLRWVNIIFRCFVDCCKPSETSSDIVSWCYVTGVSYKSCDINSEILKKKSKKNEVYFCNMQHVKKMRQDFLDVWEKKYVELKMSACYWSVKFETMLLLITFISRVFFDVNWLNLIIVSTFIYQAPITF